MSDTTRAYNGFPLCLIEFLREFSIKHRHRILLHHEGRCVEYVEERDVLRRVGTATFTEHYLVDDDGNSQKVFADSNGWVFQENMLNQLVRERKIRRLKA